MLICQACEGGAGADAGPQPTSAREAALLYMESLRDKKCGDILALVSGALRQNYDRMVENKGLDVSCEAWQGAFFPIHRIEYAYEEQLSEERAIVWLRRYRNENSFDPVRIEVALIDGVWKIISL